MGRYKKRTEQNSPLAGNPIRGQMFGDTPIPDYISDYLEAAQGASRPDVKNGLAPSTTDAWNVLNNWYATQEERQWNERMVDEERQYQEDMYNQYNSPSAMMRQYQEAGLNPALMYGNQTSPASTSSASPASTSPADVSGAAPQMDAPLGQMSAILQAIMGSVSTGSQVNDMLASANLKRSQAKLVDEQTKTERWNASFKELETKREEIKLKFEELSQSLSIEETRSRIDNMDAQERLWVSQSELNYAEVNYKSILGSLAAADIENKEVDTAIKKLQQGLVLAQQRKTNLEADKIQTILPYAADYEKAKLELTQAQSQESWDRANLVCQRAQLEYLKTVKAQGLLDAGEIDLIIEQMQRENSNIRSKTISNYVNSATYFLSSAADVALSIFTKGLSKVTSKTHKYLDGGTRDITIEGNSSTLMDIYEKYSKLF